MGNTTKSKEITVGVDNSAPTVKESLNDDYITCEGVIETPTDVEAVVKPYTFRNLNSTDLFLLVKVISKIGVDEFAAVVDGDLVTKLLSINKNNDEDKDEDKVKQKENSSLFVGVGIALKIANKILEHIPRCEDEIYTLLASVSGMDVKCVQELDLDVFLEMLIDFVSKKEFKSFFKVASKYIK